MHGSINLYENFDHWHPPGLQYFAAFSVWYKDGIIKKLYSASLRNIRSDTGDKKLDHNKVMENPKENPPFRDIGEKIFGGTFFDLRELKSRPDLLVKELQDSAILFALFYDKGEPNPEEIAGDLQKFLESVRSYDISDSLPKTYIVVGPNEEGKKTVFQISERIQGKTIFDLEKSGEFTEEIKGQLQQILEKFVRFFIQTFDYGTGQFIEIENPANYVMGKNLAKHEEFEHIYLVDFFPTAKITIAELREHINNFEKRFNFAPGSLSSIYDLLNEFQKRR